MRHFGADRMFTIRFKTVVYRRDLQIAIRNNVDGWGEDIPGIYEIDEWRFELPEDQYAAGCTSSDFVHALLIPNNIATSPDRHVEQDHFSAPSGSECWLNQTNQQNTCGSSHATKEDQSEKEIWPIPPVPLTQTFAGAVTAQSSGSSVAS